MLQRVLEPEVMDSVEDARDYDAMNHSTVNRIFVSDFLAAVPNPTGTILDVGTGTAQIPIMLCQQASGYSILAIDAAENMIQLGRSNVEKAGLLARIQLAHRNARRLPDADHAFSAVISNSIVHHISEPEIVLGEMMRVCAAGGVVFVRDLLRPQSLAELNALVSLYAGEANPHQRQLFADSLHAALTISEVSDIVQKLGLDRSTVQQTSDRHWTFLGSVP